MAFLNDRHGYPATEATMSNMLILMRHGKAQRPTEDMLDIERKLTESGERSLVATLPSALGLMPSGGAKTEIWSSPAARAVQTARIMQKACKRHGVKVGDDIITVDSLWTQDSDSFLEAVRESGADCVIAVGHNPFIEDLTARLTGSRIDFATGGFAAIQLAHNSTTLQEFPGRLLWFSQGPISQRWKTLVQMEGVIGDCENAVHTRLQAFFDNPDDIETMHKFRVSIRTLRSLIAFVKPWQDAKQNQSVQADLKEIVAETSRLRELDVLTEQATEMESSSTDLVEFCALRAEEERERVYEALKSKRISKRLDNVASQLHSFRWRKDLVLSGLESSEVRKRFDKLAASLESDLASLNLADVEKTHDVRKSAKRVRYDAEKFTSLIGSDAVDIAKNMTAHQDNLGAICDARVNVDIINGFSADELPEAVAWDLALLRAKNETFLYSTLKNG